MTVFIYAPETLADWEIAFLTAELNSKRYFKDKNTDINLVFTGNTLNPVHTMGGTVIKPEITLDRIHLKPSDMLVLPGADTWFAKENQNALLFAKECVKSNFNVAAICGATVGLAKEGVLNSIAHTSNDREFLKMMCPDYTGEAFYVNTPAHTEKNLITASGLAPLEFTREVLKKLAVFKESTLESWYNLYIEKDARNFFSLMASLKENS